MPESVTAVAGSTVEAPGFEAYGLPEAEAPQGSELDKDAFLKLLVAQLKYQDPLEPQSSDEFIATSAQFTMVEKLDELTKQGENTALITSLTTASSLIGREVTTLGPEGSITAIVQRSEIVSGAVELVTDKGNVPMNQVVSVGLASGDATESQDPTPTSITDTAAAPVAAEDLQ